MEGYESFGRCLQRLLDEAGMSASAAARLVGFRSRNSIFRILNDETSVEINMRFLSQLRDALTEQWPQEAWRQMENALDIERVGLAQHASNRAFCQAMDGRVEKREFMVEIYTGDGMQHRLLEDMLGELIGHGKTNVVLCGCCERCLSAALASCLNEAGSQGRLSVRHYVDISGESVVSSLLSVMPLLSKTWYNARLVDEGHCSQEMLQLYRLNSIFIHTEGADRSRIVHCLIQCDRERFIYSRATGQQVMMYGVLDRSSVQMEDLKPITPPVDGPEAFVEYSAYYARLEKDNMLLSVKPDVHINLVPMSLVYDAIREGFARSGMVGEMELDGFLGRLKEIHDARVANMYGKHRPTHLVYSLQAMERFMRTGVLSDHFFLQRAFTPVERREIIRSLIRQVQHDPYFNVRFLKPDMPEIRAEMTFFEGRGVLVMDAYTSHNLHGDHSEALLTQPDFMASFQRFFMDVLLERLTMTTAESLSELEKLLRI